MLLVIATLVRSLALLYATASLITRRVLSLFTLILAQAIRRIGLTRQLSGRRSALVIAVLAQCAIIIPWPIQFWTIIKFPMFVMLFGIVFTFGYRALELPRDLRGLLAHAPSDDLIAHQLRNPLDAIFVRLLLYHSALISPPFIALIIRASAPEVILLYVTMLIVCSDTFELLDHTNIHNRVFRASKHSGSLMRIVMGAMTIWQNYVLTLMMARIPFWYRVQHVFIHHVENNGPKDPQSTMLYDRTSYLDFCVFALKMGISLCVPWDVFRYLIREGRFKPFRMLAASMLGYAFLVSTLALWNFPAAVTLIAIRFSAGVESALLNFYEHGLIDPADPLNIYGNASTVQALDNDHGSLGADYHIAHHLHPSRHWSLLIDEARENENVYTQKGVIIFRDADAVVRNLFARRFTTIAAHCVMNGKSPRELATEIERRAHPLIPKPKHRIVVKTDELLGQLAARVFL